MNIVITSTGNTPDSKFDLRFGRAAYFCLYDTDVRTMEFIENPYVDAQGGAGTKSAEKMIELGVKRVISGDFGPKAKDLMDKFKIQMVILDNQDQSIESIIAQFNN